MHEELKQRAKPEAEEVCGTRPRPRRQAAALAASAQFAALARGLEIVFSRQFSVLLKLHWAVPAIIKAHRLLS